PKTARMMPLWRAHQIDKLGKNVKRWPTTLRLSFGAIPDRKPLSPTRRSPRISGLGDLKRLWWHPTATATPSFPSRNFPRFGDSLNYSTPGTVPTRRRPDTCLVLYNLHLETPLGTCFAREHGQ